uniref:Tetratricopeptide repeat protein n=1 Tax=Geobacter sp. (strain M21) TaxID=443144 RepID=C6E5T5_GEOSM
MSRRVSIVLVGAGLIAYVLVIGPFAAYLREKPVEEKLGYVPSVKVMKSLGVDQKELAGASLVFKVLMYYGTVMGEVPKGTILNEPGDLQGMSRLLHAAVQLDPYNMDAYYFAQGILTWDAHQYQVANNLLDYGMKYRNWDWFLPFFAGFNSAYFLKDYEKAAQYYDLAGELSGEPLYKSLASRYMQESGQTELAIAYLGGMVKSAKNDAMKKSYQLRLQAFQEVSRIEKARDRYKADKGKIPASVEQLVQSGYLESVPVDPYGGSFYLEADGKVATTSKFALGKNKK